MVRIESGKAHQEIRLVRIEITLDNLLARRKILRMKIAQLLISGILDRLRVPFPAVAGVRAQDDRSARVGGSGILGHDVRIVFPDVDDGDMAQRADQRVLDTGAGQDVGSEFPAEPVQPPRSFQQSDGDPQLTVFPPLLQDVVIRNPGVFQQFLQDIFLLDQDSHFVSVRLQPGDGVLVIMEVGRMPQIDQYPHADGIPFFVNRRTISS